MGLPLLSAWSTSAPTHRDCAAWGDITTTSAPHESILSGMVRSHRCPAGIASSIHTSKPSSRRNAAKLRAYSESERA